MQYLYWGSIKFGFVPGSPILELKALPNKDDSIPRDSNPKHLVKDEGVLTTPPQPLLVKVL